MHNYYVQIDANGFLQMKGIGFGVVGEIKFINKYFTKTIIMKFLDKSKNDFFVNPNISRTTKDFLVRAKLSDFNIPYIDRFVFKPFFGLSYNLSKRNAFQAVSNKGLDYYTNNSKTSSGAAITTSN